jgi:5-methylthioadenosine/S-adenosylhomocysteine deaminase
VFGRHGGVRGAGRGAAVAAAILAWAGVAWAQPATKRKVALVVTNATVVTVDGSRRILAPGAVAIEGADIVGVDTPAAIAGAFEPQQTIDGTGQILLPGLINTHTHAAMVLMRGLADDLALMEWLQQYIFPAEAKTVSPAFVRTGTRLAALEMIRSGTTTFADMYYFEEEVAKAASEAGLRGVLGQTIIRFPVADAKTPEEGLARTERFVAAWKAHPLITPAVAPHALYTLEPATLKASRALADKHGVPLLIHLAETRAEVDSALQLGQTTPTRYLQGLGLWGPRTLAAHGVWVSPEDMRFLKTAGVAVSHNPESNMKLASGTAPVIDYHAAGVPVALGTDGAASNNDLDMFEAMRFAALLQKHARNDPQALPAKKVLEMATRDGAAALGLADRVGSIEVGRKADVILVDVRGARQTPIFDPVSHLVYVAHGDDVTTTIVNGQVLMRDRAVLTLDEAAVLAEARAAAESVRAAVKK